VVEIRACCGSVAAFYEIEAFILLVRRHGRYTRSDLIAVEVVNESARIMVFVASVPV